MPRVPQSSFTEEILAELNELESESKIFALKGEIYHENGVR